MQLILGLFALIPLAALVKGDTPDSYFAALAKRHAPDSDNDSVVRVKRDSLNKYGATSIDGMDVPDCPDQIPGLPGTATTKRDALEKYDTINFDGVDIPLFSGIPDLPSPDLELSR